ncbi:MAG: outer membrane protein assembly factor BamB family protein [Nocardioidaceae bacterium]
MQAVARGRIRAVLALVAALVLAVGTPSLTAAATPGSCPDGGTWMQFHAGPTKTGWNCAEHVLSPGTVGGLLPRWAAGGAAEGWSPVVVGDTVFFVTTEPGATGNLDATLRAVRREDGGQLWSTALPGELIPPGALAYADGAILLVTGGALQAYRSGTGAPVWSVRVGSSHGPTVSGHTAYVGTSDGSVVAVSTRTGATRWTATLPAEFGSHLAVSGGRVFVATAGDDGDLYALDKATGAIRWRATVGQVFGGGAAVRGDTVYVAADVGGEGGTGSVIALSARTGERRWLARVEDDVHSVPAVDDHNVYVGAIVNGVHAYDAATGAPRWTTDVGGQEIWSSIASANGVAYLVTDSGTTYALRTTDGEVLWSTQPAGPHTSATMGSPAVVGGRLYVPYGDSGVIAYGLPH